MIKSILLTGGTGFIGSNLLEELLKKKYEVILIKRSTSNTNRIQRLLDKIKIYDLDKINLSEVFENKIDAVIHLATYYKKIHSPDDVKPMIDSNIEFPSKILEMCVKKNIKYFINTGTFFEYNLSTKKVLDEKSELKPFNLYASTKIAFSNILNYYSDFFGLKVIELKLFSPYGPKDNEKLFPYIIKNLLEGKKISITKGEQKWNWTYVSDLCSAYIKALERIQSNKENYEVFNIGADKQHSIREIVDKVENILGVSGLVSYDKKYPENEIFFVACNNNNARKILHWTPKVEIDEGINLTINYYKSEVKQNGKVK